MNKVFLTGYLGRDPEMSTSQRTGTPVSRSSVAVNDSLSRDDNSRVQFINIVGFNNHANFMNTYLHKGDFVVIEGRLSQSRYVNKNGQNTYSTNVIIDSITSNPRRDVVSTQMVGSSEVGQSLPTNSGFVNEQTPVAKMQMDVSSEIKSTVGDEWEDPFTTSTFRVDNPQNNNSEVKDDEITWSDDME